MSNIDIWRDKCQNDRGRVKAAAAHMVVHEMLAWTPGSHLIPRGAVAVRRVHGGNDPGKRSVDLRSGGDEPQGYLPDEDRDAGEAGTRAGLKGLKPDGRTEQRCVAAWARERGVSGAVLLQRGQVPAFDPETAVGVPRRAGRALFCPAPLQT